MIDHVTQSNLMCRVTTVALMMMETLLMVTMMITWTMSIWILPGKKN